MLKRKLFCWLTISNFLYIIVLIILAGVAISMLSGDNEILNQAASAKQQTEEQGVLEQVKLAVMAAIGTDGNIDTETLSSELEKIDGVNRGEIILPTEIEIKGQKVSIEEDGTVTLQGGSGEKVTIADLISSGQAVTTNTTLEDTNGDSITIPQGFKLSSESPELVTEGMIIEDSENNQYVWIPVFVKSDDRTWGVDYSNVQTEIEDSNKYYKAIETSLKNYTKTYDMSDKMIVYGDEWYGGSTQGKYGYYDEENKISYYSNGNMTQEEYNDLYHNMLVSVYKNGGFYIGRYEMGIKVVESPEQAQEVSRTSASKEYMASSTNSTNEAPSIEGMTKPISKANAVAYNYITQSQAQMLAESLIYSNVTSSLIFGVQWDAVCAFIEHYDKNNSAPKKSDWVNNSNYGALWGNYKFTMFMMNRGYYSTSYQSTTVRWYEKSSNAKDLYSIWLCTTGSSDQNCSLNIYDFNGNLMEWTLEAVTNYNR